MQRFKIVAYLLLGCSDSGGYVKFTPKYIIVGGDFFKGSNHILLVTEDHMQHFKILPYLLLGYFWLVEGGGEEFVDFKGFLSLSGSFSWGCG
jgi:hypothetical protein